MATRGGARPNAGRKAGSPNRKTQELQERVASEGITPLDYMLNIMRDAKADPVMRFEASKAAAPYIHPKLSSVESKNENTHSFDLPTKIELTAPGHDNSKG